MAIALVTLGEKDDWARRLPPGLLEMTERLLIASGATGYGARMVQWAKRPWMMRVYGLKDRMMPGQFEGFGCRKTFVDEQVEAAIADGARQVLIVGAGSLCHRRTPKGNSLNSTTPRPQPLKRRVSPAMANKKIWRRLQ